MTYVDPPRCPACGLPLALTDEQVAHLIETAARSTRLPLRLYVQRPAARREEAADAIAAAVERGVRRGLRELGLIGPAEEES